MTKVKFILSSISVILLFSSVNHTSMYENSVFNVFKNINSVGEIQITDQMIYFVQLYTRLLNLIDNLC